MTETTGLSAVERLRQPSIEELKQMRIDGRGTPSVVRWLVEQELARLPAAPNFAGYNAMGNWSKPTP